VTAQSEDVGDQKNVHVSLTNTGSSLAFMITLRVQKGQGGEEALPSTFSDDWFSLLPGELREVTAELDASALDGAAPVVAVSGWNVPSSTVAP
jgi:exo-1,4-beta-D-glucosaminidase